MREMRPAMTCRGWGMACEHGLWLIAIGNNSKLDQSIDQQWLGQFIGRPKKHELRSLAREPRKTLNISWGSWRSTGFLFILCIRPDSAKSVGSVKPNHNLSARSSSTSSSRGLEVSVSSSNGSQFGFTHSRRCSGLACGSHSRLLTASPLSCWRHCTTRVWMPVFCRIQNLHFGIVWGVANK